MLATLLAIMVILLIIGVPMMIPLIVAPLVVILIFFPNLGPDVIAGIGPGILIFLFFAVYSYFYARIKNIPLVERVSWPDRWKVTYKAILPLGFPVIIVGGIYTGLFSPTEAAGISVLYALILEVLIYRSITFKDIPRIALSTGLVTSAVFVLVAGGQAFSWVISYARIPHMISEAVLGTEPSALYVLIIVAIFFFIGCMFVDPIVVILILTPIFYPPAMAAGIDPVHLGVVITFQAALGSATPPFGVDIFTASAVFNKSYLDVIKGTPPYIVMLLIVSMLVIFFEEISLFYRFLL